MKIQILQEDFAKALTLVSRFVNTRAQLPLLENILLSGEKTRLVISATNLETSASTSIGAKVEGEGRVTVPAKVISDLVTNLPPGQIEIEEDKEHLIIKSQGFSGEVLGMNASDFPQTPARIS